MSIEISKNVWKWSKAEGNTRLVLLAVADFANPYGQCWPGVKRLAAMCKLSERSIQRHIRELERLGELAVDLEKGRSCHGGHTNFYRITVKPDTTQVCSSDTGPGDISGISPVTPLSPPPVTAPSPKPSVKPSEETITTTLARPSGEAGSVVEAPLELIPEERHIPPIPPSPLPVDLETFSTALIKLRENFTRRPVPRFGPKERQRIADGLQFYHGYKLKKLLIYFLAAWDHWETVKKDFNDGKRVDGFYTKHAWPPDLAFKHFDKIEEFILDEVRRYREWYDDILEEVEKVLST